VLVLLLVAVGTFFLVRLSAFAVFFVAEKIFGASKTVS
jgi:hypothetical protein